MSHPLLKIIDVKNDRQDLQRALYQLLVSKESLLLDKKDVYAVFYVALSTNLYNDLVSSGHFEVFVKVYDTHMTLWSGGVVGSSVDKTNLENKKKTWRLGLGIVVLDENRENPWENKKTIMPAGLMKV